MKTAQYLSAVARAHPNREAVVCGDERRSYGELAARAAQVCAALGARGIGVGDRVAFLVENSVAWVELFYGVVAIGALAVPVNLRLMPAEIGAIIADAQPALVICEAHFADLLVDVPAGTAVVERAELEREADTCVAAPFPLLPELPDDCMIIYTSGTSGNAKGAIATHANFFFIAFMHALEWELRADDRILISTAFAHRVAIARLYNALTLGATLVLMRHFDVDAALDTFERERITVAGIVPTIARMLLTRIELNDPRCASLRTVNATGEAFPVALKQQLLAKLPHIKLYSYLAMTEAAGMGTLMPEHQFTHAASVGRPTLGVDVRLLADDGSTAPAGAIGEIAVRCGEPGRQAVTRGYFNRPAETAAAFRDGWFLTGDLGRFDDDGFLYVVDRKKDMILSGGLNIYSREVETALVEHPAVAEAAVVGIPDELFGEAVAAFVVLAPGASASQDDLIAHCRAHIASYKKPKVVYFVDSFPKNQLGKVLKRVLREQADLKGSTHHATA
jgi:acyl-CoA synthetase (AMP-forming)/AMP-acid ligase II